MQGKSYFYPPYSISPDIDDRIDNQRTIVVAQINIGGADYPITAFRSFWSKGDMKARFNEYMQITYIVALYIVTFKEAAWNNYIKIKNNKS